jgi:hypothetical protein
MSEHALPDNADDAAYENAGTNQESMPSSIIAFDGIFRTGKTPRACANDVKSFAGNFRGIAAALRRRRSLADVYF